MLTDEKISLVLNTYMYLDYKEAADGLTVNEIVSELSDFSDCQKGGIHYEEYTILSKAAENPAIGQLVIGNQSHHMGMDSGTNACTFQDENNNVYVVFRGTGDGEWMDNGIGLTAEKTIQQERALTYYETVVEKEHFTEDQKIVITGHSKGGNKAQYVTMTTKYGELTDRCINVDGQGFSSSAIESFQKNLGSKEYERRLDQIYSVCGENDFVNSLGISIIKPENVRYVKTPVEVSNFAGYHDITYLFASREKNLDTGKMETIFHGRKNSDVPKQGVLGLYAAALSAAVMALPDKKREGCSQALMQLMELQGERKMGLNGEKLSISDIYHFFHTGIPLIENSILSKDGISMLKELFTERSFSVGMTGKLKLYVQYQGLMKQTEGLQEMATQIKQYRQQLDEIVDELPLFMKNSWMLCHKVKKEMNELEAETHNIKQLWHMLEEIITIYQKTDEALISEVDI